MTASTTATGEWKVLFFVSGDQDAEQFEDIAFRRARLRLVVEEGLVSCESCFVVLACVQRAHCVAHELPPGRLRVEEQSGPLRIDPVVLGVGPDELP
jgi:hypothetical protein